MSWYYITAGLALWAVDHIIRFSRSVGISVAVQDIKVSKGNSKVVQLSYLVSQPSFLTRLRAWNPFGKDQYEPLSHEMGQYVYINIPEISTMAWHPFRSDLNYLCWISLLDNVTLQDHESERFILF